MELFADVADTRGEDFFDKHMDVLGVLIDLELAGRDIIEYLSERVAQGFRFICGDDTLFCEHLRMGDRARDILLVHTAVKADG